MMPDGFIDQIKATGYTRVVIRPTDKPETLTVVQARDIVDKSSVSLRGWDYPHIPHRDDEHGGNDTAADFAQGWCDWYCHREFWRMYKSGQFLHYKALREDLSKEGNIPQDGPVLATGSLIYSATEVVEFTYRLFRNNIYQGGASIDLTIGKTRGRQLWIDNPNRMPFSVPRKTASEAVAVGVMLTPSDFMAVDPKDPAMEMLLKVFDAFGWSASPEQIRKSQDELYGLGLGRG